MTKSDDLAGKVVVVALKRIFQCVPRSRWENEKTQKMFEFALEALLDPRLKVRKTMTQIMNSIFKDILPHFPYIKERLRLFALKFLTNESTLKGNVFYLIYFLNSSLRFLPIDLITEIIEAFFNLLKMERDKISTHVYLCIESLLRGKVLNQELVMGLLENFFKNQPDFFKNEKQTFAYSQCLTEAILHLYRLSPYEACKYISGAMSILCELLLLESGKMRR